MDSFDTATDPADGPSDRPAAPDPADDTAAPAKPERRPSQWAVPVLAMVVIVAVPWLAWALLPGGAVAAVVLVVCVVTAVIGGFWDGRSFRSSWTFPAAVGVAFWMAGNLYFNDGSWVYIPLLVVLAIVAGWVGDRAGGRARAAASGSVGPAAASGSAGRAAASGSAASRTAGE